MADITAYPMRDWDQKDLELLTGEWNSGATVEAIALRLHRSTNEVKLKAEALGLKKFRRKQRDNDLEL